MWIVAALFLCVCTMAPPAVADKADVQERIRASADVFNEIMNTPDKGIPEELLETAHCIVIVPSMVNAGFIIGGKYGRGVATCRTGSRWSPPSMVMTGGGSVGFQIGGQSVDLVMLIMNKGGEDFLFRDKVTLGGDVSATAGPVGRHASAETNATMKSQILTWSRSQGLFAGVSLNGATLRPDKDANRALYGSDVTPRQILAGNVSMPAAAKPLIAAITRRAGEVGGTEPGANKPAEPRGLGKTNKKP